MDERTFGRLEQKVDNMPTHETLGTVRAELLTAMQTGMSDLRRTLEKHEDKTAKAIDESVTRTVESAFNLQWQKIETAIAQKIPEQPKRDWMPYIALAGVVLIAGFERGVPMMAKLLGF